MPLQGENDMRHESKGKRGWFENQTWMFSSAGVATVEWILLSRRSTGNQDTRVKLRRLYPMLDIWR